MGGGREERVGMAGFEDGEADVGDGVTRLVRRKVWLLSNQSCCCVDGLDRRVCRGVEKIG